MAFRHPPRTKIEKYVYPSGGCSDRIEVKNDFQIKRCISDYLVFKLQI